MKIKQTKYSYYKIYSHLARIKVGSQALDCRSYETYKNGRWIRDITVGTQILRSWLDVNFQAKAITESQADEYMKQIDTGIQSQNK